MAPRERESSAAARAALSVATYNIHQCSGTDGRWDPKRVLRVIRRLRADIIGLQEVHSEEGRTPDLAQLDYLAHGAGLTPLAGPTMLRGRGHYGNALLSKFPVLQRQFLDLSVKGREPRGAIDAVLRVNRHDLRVVVTHLGLRARERRLQMEQLLRALDSSAHLPLIVLADMNEWFPLRGALRKFSRYFGKLPAPPTFPASLPVFSLDRIWMRPAQGLQEVKVYNTALSRSASDHLPLTAVIRHR